ncbi:MAG TPA: CPBP family intramembrane glutamic endopeptidase [Candidatus Saccharimonadales bacterium]|nr:CPBP family intramembrane glutamic endopeptidase [Candidatus Saccharimonadales bacterium]
MSKEHSSRPWLAPKQWGAVLAVVLGFLAYKVPEWIVTGLAPALLPLLPTNENVRLFALHGLFEALAIGAVFMLVVWFNSSFKELGLNRFKLEFIYKAILAWSAYFVITASVMYVMQQVMHVPDDPQNIGYSNPNALEMALAFLALVIVVPIAEELLFRGFIFKGIRSQYSFVVSALAVSVLFGVAHGQLNVGIDTFCLSLVLCYLVEKTNSLWPGILVHALKNAVAFVLIFIYNVR